MNTSFDPVEQLSVANNVQREEIINRLAREERTNPGTIFGVTQRFADTHGVHFQRHIMNNSFSTVVRFDCGNKQVRATYCGSQYSVVITPSFLANVLRYVVEAA